MFVGREQELASLEEFYAKDGIGMTVIYGRRRIGKSTLITEFVKDKKTVFYTATKIGKTRNLELFSKQVLDLFMPGIENISFNSIEAVFDFIDKNIQTIKKHFKDTAFLPNSIYIVHEATELVMPFSRASRCAATMSFMKKD